uniref:Ovule protein n=1 Tax=Mesocestoides corti TaxID=53468 RepID=A0A5K3FPC7_MESCO
MQVIHIAVGLLSQRCRRTAVLHLHFFFKAPSLSSSQTISLLFMHSYWYDNFLLVLEHGDEILHCHGIT